jgi:hypothetical protein
MQLFRVGGEKFFIVNIQDLGTTDISGMTLFIGSWQCTGMWHPRSIVNTSPL